MYQKVGMEVHALCLSSIGENSKLLQQGMLNEYLGADGDEDKAAGKLDFVFENMAEIFTDICSCQGKNKSDNADDNHRFYDGYIEE